MTKENILLEFKNVTDKSKKIGLKQVSFTLEKGYIMGLAGKNASGKTTLYRHIIDHRLSYTGEILFEGRNILECESSFKDELAILSEEESYFPEYTIEEHACLFGTLYTKWSEEKFHMLIRECGLAPRQKMKDLSKGERMRYQLTFAIAHNPKLYLMDEATAGMDIIFLHDFYRILRKHMGETASVIVTSHKESELSKYADFIARMEHGALVSYIENVQ